MSGRKRKVEHVKSNTSSRCRPGEEDDSPNYVFNLLPVRRHDVVAVLWPHQHGSEAKGGLFQAGTLTFDDGRGEDGNHVYAQAAPMMAVSGGGSVRAHTFHA